MYPKCLVPTPEVHPELLDRRRNRVGQVRVEIPAPGLEKGKDINTVNTIAETDQLLGIGHPKNQFLDHLLIINTKNQVIIGEKAVRLPEIMIDDGDLILGTNTKGRREVLARAVPAAKVAHPVLRVVRNPQRNLQTKRIYLK